MPNAFVNKLNWGARLSEADRALLEATASRPRRLDAKQPIILQGAEPDAVHLVLEGYACRSKLLPSGLRQIMALLLPGDCCDLHVAVLGEMDHDIVTLTPCQIVDISRRDVLSLLQQSQAITQALWWSTLVDEATLREWLVNMGRRPADRQMAHLFCELLLRLDAVGLARDDSYDLPFTQEELGDMLGLSVVHVNRVLQKLRSDGLVDWRGARMRILDAQRLRDFAEFDPSYLHLREGGWTTNAG